MINRNKSLLHVLLQYTCIIHVYVYVHNMYILSMNHLKRLVGIYDVPMREQLSRAPQENVRA